MEQSILHESQLRLHNAWFKRMMAYTIVAVLAMGTTPIALIFEIKFALLVFVVTIVCAIAALYSHHKWRYWDEKIRERLRLHSLRLLAGASNMHKETD